MAGTRSLARLSQGSSPQSAKSSGGTKRKADDSSPSSGKAKRGRPSKEQKTLEETMSTTDNDNTNANDNESIGAQAKGTEDAQPKDTEPSNEDGEQNGNTEQEEKPVNGNDESNALDQVKADVKDPGSTSKDDDNDKPGEDVDMDAKPEAVEEDKERKEAMPSNILEKGIVYFFTRGRVGVDNPEAVQDLQRSYFVLRPLPDGAKITDGAIQDVGNNRLVALPKKVWPKSGKDRFMAFIEKAATSMDTLKEEFFQGSEYTTKTTGTRHTPEVTPIGEGVYAMTSTGGGQGTTHLAYMLTIPDEIGEVQKDVGLAEKGSFVLSVKNPESPSPNTNALPQTAEYPKEIIEEFHGRGWLAAQPKHLNYTNASFLLIGENFETSDNLDPKPKEENDDTKKTPQEELEKLENEDELRIEHLKGDDTIFADLGISSKDYPKVMTTW